VVSASILNERLQAANEGSFAVQKSEGAWS